MKYLVFDMDGTIADLYGVKNWLDDLRNYRATPYENARPMWDMKKLENALKKAQINGYKIAVVSWLSKESTKEYDEKVRTAKRKWLERNNFPADEIHLVKYGTTKANVIRKKTDTAILFDDNEQVRKGWHLGTAVNPLDTDIIKYLNALC